MLRKYSIIRDISTIEEQLNSAPAGIINFHAEDKLIQYPTSYVYIDKNIFIIFRDGEEYYGLIKYGSYATFNVIREGKPKRSKSDSIHGYKYISISINGSIKKLDDPKQLEECIAAYLKKYSHESLPKDPKKISALSQIIMIDSEEIQAFEESIS